MRLLLAEHEGVEQRHLIAHVGASAARELLGHATILQVLNITKVGKSKRGCGVRLVRDDVVIHEGTLSTLKRFKEEVLGGLAALLPRDARLFGAVKGRSGA